MCIEKQFGTATMGLFRLSQKEENLECQDISKTQPGPAAKNATLGHPAGNRTRDLANLVRRTANLATEAIAASIATSSVLN